MTSIARREGSWQPVTRRTLPVVILCALIPLVLFTAAIGHAVLARSEPAANAVLTTPPTEIRLWFTEPLEAQFSSIDVLDSTGTTIAAGGQVAPDDPNQIALPLGELAAGIYTVAWHNTSASDGHPERGSFPFTVADAANQAPQPVVSTAVAAPEEEIPRAGSLARGFNLMSLAVLVGSLGFACLIWRPFAPQPVPAAERRLTLLMWCGWLATGVAGIFVLLNQVSTMAGIPLPAALLAPELTTVLTDTRFGALWLARVALWLFLGPALWLGRTRAGWWWAALSSATLILLLTSLFSHAAAEQNRLPAVAGDFAHLTLACFWTGGLIAFLVVIDPVRRALAPPAVQVGQLAHFFSACARVAVVGLLITGFYAAWLLVTTFGGLTSTLYGRLLLVKLLLLLPLLAIAAMNLLWVQHRLRADLPIWIPRLRLLIGTEVFLLVAIFAIVGAMTSINPARNVVDQRALAVAAAAVPAPRPFVPVLKPIAMHQMVDDLMIDLFITPGYVGNNEFHVSLSTMDGAPITDASLIRLRFNNLSEDMGQSELRIEPPAGGQYAVSGANLSAPGDWQIRVSIQRPDQYDSVVDFEPRVDVAPPLPTPLPTPVPVIALPSEAASIQAWRTPALLVTGILALAAGALFLALQRFRFWVGPGLLASLLIVVGIVFIAGAWVA